MSKLKPTRDMQPVTEFRANAAQFIEQVRDTGEPMILTQHGRSAAVLLDVESYKSLMDEVARPSPPVKVIWSPLAEQRAVEAVDYIAQDRPQAAAAWLEELLERVAGLRTQLS